MHASPVTTQAASNFRDVYALCLQFQNLGGLTTNSRSTPFVPTLPLGLGDAFALPLKKEATLERSDRPQDMQDQLASC
ncbi:hypothetical protein SAMN04487779_102719 [Belnapia rosea]|uniref:Uncharacterized protein n=1 Tax=Belnapia rosea TaxID=938405 RepID=A0A1G7BTE2_9PROT|nr:hypothetical protein SAMN04487779_102719 [Belnapia rosea]